MFLASDNKDLEWFLHLEKGSNKVADDRINMGLYFPDIVFGGVFYSYINVKNQTVVQIHHYPGKTEVDEEIVTLNEYLDVTFNYDNGNAPSTKKVSYGNKVTEPETPVKNDYDFSGWYTSDGQKFDFNKSITTDTVLYAHFYAHWNVKTCTNGATNYPYCNNNNGNNTKPVTHKITISKKAKTTKKYVKITGIKYDGKKLKKGIHVFLLYKNKRIDSCKLTTAGTIVIKGSKYKEFFKKVKKLAKKKYKKNKYLSIYLKYSGKKVALKVKMK
jgi:uncharacterized repeat protein (TIGR02543 family)